MADKAQNGSRVRTRFGQVEAGLAHYHRVANDKRTQFQARLRKLQRFGIANAPVGGGVALFTPLRVLEFAAALELTEFGMGPERMRKRLSDMEWGMNLAYGDAARDVIQGRDATRQVLVTFSPDNLADLKREMPFAAFALLGIGDSDDIVNFIRAHEVDRQGLINVTKLVRAGQSCFPRMDHFAYLADVYEGTKESCREYARQHTRASFDYVARHPGLDYVRLLDGDLSPPLSFQYRIDDLGAAKGAPESLHAVMKAFSKDMNMDGQRAYIDLPFSQRFMIDLSFDGEGGIESLRARAQLLKEQADNGNVETFPLIYVAPSVADQLCIREKQALAAVEGKAAILGPGHFGIFVARTGYSRLLHDDIYARVFSGETVEELARGNR